jgi:quercetin dioxygenase-like cupin family protein
MIDAGERDVAAGRVERPQHHTGPEVSVLLTGADTGGRFAVVEIGAVPGSEPPLHLHTREDELVYVLEGELTYYADAETRTATAGACVFLARGCEHTFSVLSDGARLLVIVAPAGLEGSYGELGGGGTGAVPDLERLVTVAARYGVEITGPPPGTE